MWAPLRGVCREVFVYTERTVDGMGKITTDKRAGFTLMELMVYIAIVGIVVIVAGQAFSNSTKMRVRTQSMLKASEVAENVAALMVDDIAQMGAKSSLENVVAGGNDVFDVDKKATVYMDPLNMDDENKDSSSYRLVTKEDGQMDSLIFRKIRYDADGKYQAVEEVAWFLEGEGNDMSLNRQCVILTKSASVDPSPCAPQGTKANAMGDYVVEMATGVSGLKVLQGVPLVRSNADNLRYREEQIFPPAGDNFRLFPRYGEENFNIISASSGGNPVSLSGFTANYNMATGQVDATSKLRQQVIVLQNTDDPVTSWDALCAMEGNNFTFIPREEYEISFKVPLASLGSESINDMQMFVPGRDHMSVGFVDLTGKKPALINDFLFYPPSASEGGDVERSMRFTVPDSVKNVCMAFTFAIYSPVAAKGTLSIKDLKLKRIASSSYVFNQNNVVAIKDKKNVKAFKLELTVNRGGQNGQRGETGNVNLVVPTPSNGLRD